MRIVLDTHCRVFGASQGQCNALCEMATWKDPKYEKSAQFTHDHRPSKNLSPTIQLFDDLPDEIALPRALAPRVLSYLCEPRAEDAMARPTHGLVTSGNLVPRPYQREAVEAVLAHRGGVVMAPCGSGKTVIALYLAETLRTPTLILVHTRTLLDQTADKVRQFLGVEPGIIGDGVWRPGPITVATVQTIAHPSRAKDVAALRDHFGLVVQDEAHHVPAETFAAVMQSFSAAIRVGLTATPHRGDGLEPILFAVIGPVVYQLDSSALPLRPFRIDTGWKPLEVPTRKEPGWAKRRREENGEPEPTPQTDSNALMDLLVASPDRTARVCAEVRRLHCGTSIVVTERVEHVRTLVDGLRALGLRAIGLSGTNVKVGKKTKYRKPTDAERADALGGLEDGHYEILVSTPGIVGEGFDCPRVDTTFLATPFGDATRAEQLAGRACRPYPGKTAGRVVDFVDAEVDPLMRQWWRRFRVWKSLSNADVRKCA